MDWRVAEVFDPGALLNPINSPLTCGDVFFQTTDNQKYVLLAQACDIAVRGGGERNREDAVLVKMSIGKPQEKIRQRFFVIERMESDDQPWALDFTAAVTVNVRVLDLVVFNPDGKVEWTEGQPPPIALLPGWRKRFDNLASQMRSVEIPPSVRQFCFTGSMLAAECAFAAGLRHFPLKRIGRIRSPYAEAIQASYAAFISRAAFDHDFAKGLCTANDEPARPASAESQQADVPGGVTS